MTAGPARGKRSRVLNAKQRNLNLILYVVRAYLKDFILFFYFLGFFFFFFFF